MAATQPRTALVSKWDHMVIPAMDLWRAERFYSQALGGVMFRKSGMTFREFTEKAGAVGTFIAFGREHMGFFLQFVTPLEAPTDLEHACPCVALNVAAEDFDNVVARVQETGVRMLPEREETWGRTRYRSVRCNDTEGNCLELIADERGRYEGHSVTGLSHLHLETTDLRASSDYYQRYLELPVVEEGSDWFAFGIEGGQQIYFHQVAALSPPTTGRYIARHIGLLTDDVRFATIVQRLQAAGIDEGDLQNPEPGAKPYVPPRRPNNLGTYFTEPNGLRLQLTNQDTAQAMRGCPRVRYVEE
jgi:predicted enzyme related to lactoylglutathione lyase/catechol 2,3-dioxygenase-like lactoylglutathione lyase family enzyme